MSEFGSSALFVAKDPRTCRLVPLWVDALDDLDVEPLFVHTHREPSEVAASLHNRNGLDLDYSKLVWLRYVLDAEAGSRGQRRTFTSYDAVLNDWPAVAEKISRQFDLAWPKLAASNAKDLNDIIRPELRHNKAAASAVASHALLTNWIDEVYTILERWASKGEDLNDHQRLDVIKASFDESAAAFSGAVSPKVRALLLERDEARGERDAIRTEIEAVRAKSNERHNVIVRLKEERDGALARIAELSALRPQGDDEVQRVEQQLLELRESTVAQQNQIEALTTERDGLAAEVHRHTSMLAQSKAERDDVWNELSEARTALAAAQQRLAELEVEVKKRSEENAQLRAATERRDAELAKIQTVILRYQDEATARSAQHAEDLATISHERDEAHQHLAALAENAAAVELDRARIAAERDEAHRHLAALVENAAAVELDRSQIAADRDAVRQQLNNVQHQLATLGARAASAEVKLAEARSTLSWRLTRPFRMMARRLPFKTKR
ncbi:hypothetical protein D5400_06185 [Georhizobium profundi]|uniref:Sulfotransferase family protein n=1 Tax=Georhizobium profundi TaxID=2341112 RepID=A0A3Q8XMH8_9HYPH|nr:hypothetical protein [Georhizobium profundi]AZN70916.1 hypothetical protein D5400_06185 [Georhizobium profundi]